VKTSSFHALGDTDYNLILSNDRQELFGAADNAGAA
jgi:hypothetical protein